MYTKNRCFAHLPAANCDFYFMFTILSEKYSYSPFNVKIVLK